MILENDHINLHMDLPDEGYDQSRFDWTGKIVGLSHNGKTLAGHELKDPQTPNQGLGFYNEFGIEKPVGFDEIKEGEWFHKIGIGLLKKAGNGYNFQHAYEIRPANFVVNQDRERVTMVCRSENYNDYAYVLEKEFLLLDVGFMISYRFMNTGEKVISTNEYVHNFLSINQKLIGEEYNLKFPFRIKPDMFGENINPEHKVNFEDPQEIKFNRVLKDTIFMSNLSGGKEVDAHWSLENKRVGIGISETGNFTTKSINLWGCSHVISPELFIELEVYPGETKKWSRRYEIYEL